MRHCNGTREFCSHACLVAYREELMRIILAEEEQHDDRRHPFRARLEAALRGLAERLRHALGSAPAHSDRPARG